MPVPFSHKTDAYNLFFYIIIMWNKLSREKNGLATPLIFLMI